MYLFLILATLLLGGCPSNIIDLAPDAVASGDFTIVSELANNGCTALPSQGADVCRLKVDSPITAVWRLVLPFGTGITGSVDVFYKDIEKTYPISGSVVEIPFLDLIGHPIWRSSDKGAVTALAKVDYVDDQGVKKTTRAEGLAFIIVLNKDYDPMPIDSGSQRWATTCDVQYSTSGRSALSCK